MVEHYGADAALLLRERAEQAQTMGDELTAKAWREIGDLADLILKDPCRLLDSASSSS
jgi:hypothetical protein